MHPEKIISNKFMRKIIFIYFYDLKLIPPSIKGSNMPDAKPNMWNEGTGQQITLEDWGLPKKWISK